MALTPVDAGDHQAGVTLVELMVAMAILGIVSTLLITGWISIQKSYAHSVRTNNARAEVRDAVSRIGREIRDAQPPALTTPAQAPFTLAGPMEVRFYSAFNNPDARADGTGIGVLRQTRVYLDTGGTTPQKNLYWQRDTDNSGTFTSADRTMILARNVVNDSIPDTTVTPATSYVAVFTYTYRDGADLAAADTISSADLSKIVSVRIRLLVDIDLAHAPAYASLETTVRPRNAPQQ